jgi:polysaccharide export outer membrane protein
MPDQTPEGQKITVSLSRAMAGDATQNVEIKNGDTVFIPNLVYYVTGEVKNPGRFPYEDNTTILMAATIAGGFSDKASQRGIYIIRKESGVKQKVKVGLDDVIQPGDTIVVPESWF